MLRLLEEFYFRYGFVGVAWVTPSSKIAFGRPTQLEPCTGGLAQYQFEGSDVTAFVSDFGRDGYLVVMYPFGDPMIGAPRSFMLLATAIQRALEHPEDLEPPRDDFAPVLAPRPRAPKSRGAEADG